jgi:hypothetical protein
MPTLHRLPHSRTLLPEKNIRAIGALTGWSYRRQAQCQQHPELQGYDPHGHAASLYTCSYQHESHPNAALQLHRHTLSEQEGIRTIMHHKIIAHSKDVTLVLPHLYRPNYPSTFPNMRTVLSLELPRKAWLGEGMLHF